MLNFLINDIFFVYLTYMKHVFILFRHNTNFVQ